MKSYDRRRPRFLRGRTALALIIFHFSFFIFHFPATAQHRSDALDDVLQHVPMATVFALKAFDVDNATPWTELTLTAVAAYAAGVAVTYPTKQLIGERRPDKSDHRSFPSGHAMFAFAGATMLSHEFGHASPWVTIGGYGLATLVSADRLVRDRHYLHDVCAGAAIGIGATELAYWLKKKLLKTDRVDFTFSGQQLSLAIRW